MRVDLERCAEYLEQPWDLIRELKMARAIPLLVNIVEAQDDPSMRTKLIALGSAVATIEGPVLVGAADRRSMTVLLGNERPSVTILCGKSTFEERVNAWTAALDSKHWPLEWAPEIAERFYSVGGTTIPRVLQRAEAESGGRVPEMETVWAAAREGSRPEFRGLAQHVVPRYVWKDLILAEKIQSQLMGLVHYLQHQETVFHRWGARAASQER